jgi:lipoprotein LprG
MSTPRRTPVRVSGLLLAVVAVLTLGACTSAGGSNEVHLTPDKAMVLAKTKLDETSGLHLTLSTDDLPDGIAGVKSAEGVANHDPAFDGKITVVLSGQDFEVPVIAVDGTVYAQVPLTPGWQEIVPADYGAPDPAQLMSPDKGFSALLPATTGLEEGDSVRGGKDNKEVLTEYTGSVPSSAVVNVIPTATGDFDVSYTVTDAGELRQAVLTGDFYDSGDSMTYTVGFDDYGTETDITAP